MTADEYLKDRANWLHEPKSVHSFTGDFVVEMMEEYAELKVKAYYDEMWNGLKNLFTELNKKK